MVALLASLTPMCLVVWRGITGDAVHMLEIVGVLLALAGGVVSTIGEGGGDDGADVGECIGCIVLLLLLLLLLLLAWDDFFTLFSSLFYVVSSVLALAHAFMFMSFCFCWGWGGA